MKKRIKIIFVALLALIFPIKASAINVSVSCSAPGTVTVGQSFDVTISGSANIATYWNGNTINSSGNLRSNSGTGSFVEQSSSTSVSKTYNFTALSEGTATVSQTMTVNDENYEDKSFTSNTCTINIVAASSSNSSSGGGGGSSNNYVERSSNNNLNSITIDGVTLSPEFNKDNLDYKAVVEGTVEKINIGAEAEDGKSSVEGLGEKDLVEGSNRFEIKVIAENGDEKVYVVEITRKEKDPIEVIINKKKYTVFKKESNIEPPKGFVKTNVVIEKQDVVAYSNEYIDYILVLLVDEEGESSFYIYNSKNSTYIKYNEVTSKDLRLVITKANKIPTNYKKTTIKIDKEEVEAYYLKGINDFKLVYAINMNNGEEDFYQYDSKEKTFQRYNNKIVSNYEDFTKKLEVGLVGAAALVLILIIIIFSMASSKSKMKKVLKNKKENEAIQKIAKKEEKETPIEEPKEEKELSKRELKKQQKEEKKRLKQEQENFLK